MSDAASIPTVRHVARITFQLKTPLHLGSGRPGEISDADLVYDANGLPAIPGSSIAGVLRSLWGKDSQESRAVFGFQKADGDGIGSRLTVSWGCLHDSTDRPIEGLVEPSCLANDKILRLARAPSLRDHVRITHTGVADAETRAKFDELSLQVGHRFTFEMELRGIAADRGEDAKLLRELIETLRHPGFRLGGKTRRGFGAVELTRVQYGSFDLADKTERQEYLKHPAALAEPSGVLQDYPLSDNPTAVPFAKLQLKPRGFWMFGGGADIDPSNGTRNWSAADLAPVRDTVVSWKSNPAEPVENCLVIPGSSVKGALAHRTAFHYNRLKGRFIDPDAPDAAATLKDYATNNSAIDALFGSAKNNGTGQRGHVIIDDLHLPADTPTRRVPHVSIDRFTGGALDGALFDERPVAGGHFTLRVHLDCQFESLDPDALQALRHALEDLAEGRLALGAGAGRGNGFFEGTALFSGSETEEISAQSTSPLTSIK